VPTADPFPTAHQPTLTNRREIADAERAGIVMGWARVTLTVGTAAVLVLIVARVAFGRSLLGILVTSGPDQGFAGEVAGFAGEVLPGLLVAWCLGFAVAATSVGATWLGARVVGILAGVFGVAAGTALFLLSR
jgi:hypothetical protein